MSHDSERASSVMSGGGPSSAQQRAMTFDVPLDEFHRPQKQQSNVIVDLGQTNPARPRRALRRRKPRVPRDSKAKDPEYISMATYIPTKGLRFEPSKGFLTRVKADLPLYVFLMWSMVSSMVTASLKTFWWYLFWDQTEGTFWETVLGDPETYALVTLMVMLCTLFVAFMAHGYSQACIKALTTVLATASTLEENGVIPKHLPMRKVTKRIEMSHDDAVDDDDGDSEDGSDDGDNDDDDDVDDKDKHLEATALNGLDSGMSSASSTRIAAVVRVVVTRQTRLDHMGIPADFQASMNSMVLGPMSQAWSAAARSKPAAVMAPLVGVYVKFKTAVETLRFHRMARTNKMMNILTSLMISIYFWFQPAYLISRFGGWAMFVSAAFAFLIHIPLIVARAMQSSLDPVEGVLDTNVWGLVQVETWLFFVPFRCFRSVLFTDRQFLCGSKRRRQYTHVDT